MQRHLVFGFVSLALLLGLGLWGSARAQTAGPQLLITWKTNSYVPPTYRGKILPTGGAKIVASFELIDGGKIADVSRNTVYWYLNGEFLKGGAGLQSVEFLAPGTITGTELDLRVQLPDYKKDDVILKTITIPVVHPDIAIDAPFSRAAPPPLPASFRGLPYFFTVPPVGLTFEWTVNGEPAASGARADVLDVTGEEKSLSERPLASIGLIAKNPGNPFEAAERQITFIAP